jgi:two-component system, cell cycle response regulator
MRRPTRQPRQDGPAERRRALEADNRRLESRVAELIDALGRRDELLRRIQRHEIELLRAPSLAQMFQSLIHGVASSFELQAVRLILRDPEHEIRHLLASDGVRVSDLEGVHLVDSLLPLAPRLPDLHAPWFGPYRKGEHERLAPPSGSLSLFPLRRDSELDGLLIFASADARRFASLHEGGADESCELLAHLGIVGAICTESAIARARLLRSGLTDYLTGFYNRRYLHARLREELARAQRARQTLVCLMIDVDHFKRFNDDHGHPAGDIVLREVARRIEAEMRLSDTGVRFGGDEFAIVLSQASLEDGERVAARVLKAVRGRPVIVGSLTVTVTLSIGVAVASPRAGARDYRRLAERLITAADAALYRAKSAGRNQVMVATAPVT